MQSSTAITGSKSTADVVFEKLYEDIATLAILPGSKISEAEIATRFGVSRQPVRDAFRRLHNQDLIEIRPQRATVVRRFSLPEIENVRFIRLAVELEVLERACQVWDQTHTEAIAKNLTAQADAIAAGDGGLFHDLDYEFHKMICELSGLPKAFEAIMTCKRKVDRLCVLSLADSENAADILDDHRSIADALSQRDVDATRAAMRLHVSRLDTTIADIHETHTEYFQ